MLSGSAFYDDVYHHQNDNDAPDTVNKLGPDGLTTPDPDYRKFSSETRFRDGQRARLLEASVYGTWWLGDESSINLRLGQQLVAWGVSLDRKSGVEGKRVSVCVDLGGCRIIKKKKKKNH